MNKSIKQSYFIFPLVAAKFFICGKKISHLWQENFSLVTRKFLTCGKKISHLWQQNFSQVATNLTTSGKLLTKNTIENIYTNKK